MLALDDGEEAAPLSSRSWPARDSGPSWLENRARTRASRVTFAGLELELAGDAEACARIARAAGAGMLAAGAIWRNAMALAANTPAPKFAASCRLQMVPPPTDRVVPPSGLGWDWTAEGGELVTRFAGAQIGQALGGLERSALDTRAGEAGSFEGTAWLVDDARAPHHLLGGLAVLLTHRLGGGVFHAASIELDGAVVAFIGPSGAGKSTACRHVEGAPLVSVDRLALLPMPVSPLPRRGSGWFSHPLPGGTPPVPDMPGAFPGWRPLAAILRVQKAAATAIIAPASPASAVTLLRESTFQTGLRPSAEHELLVALERVVQHVPVARLELQLGASLKPLLRRWLKSQAEERR